MLTSLVITILAAEQAAQEAVSEVMDSTPILLSVGGISLTVMGLLVGMLWRIMSLVNNTRIELKEDIGEVHERIDNLTDKYHAVDKDVAILKGQNQ